MVWTSPVVHAIFIFILLGTSGGNTFEDVLPGEDLHQSSSGVMIKEALRQLLKIPEGKPKSSTTIVSRRPLRFMMKLYKQIEAKEYSLPDHANTLRCITPLKEDAMTSLDRNSGRGNTLIYNISTSRNEHLLTSYLHLMGHRRSPNRSSRLLFYLDGANDTQRSDLPVMVIFVEEFPMDIDVTRLVKKSSENLSKRFLRLEEEQLRRGRWVKSYSKGLLRKTPFLVIISSDVQLLDVEAFGVGALNIQKTRRNEHVQVPNEAVLDSASQEMDQEEFSQEDYQRQKRSIEKTRQKSKNGFPVSENPSRSKNWNKIRLKSKDQYWIQRQSLLSPKTATQDGSYPSSQRQNSPQQNFNPSVTQDRYATSQRQNSPQQNFNTAVNEVTLKHVLEGDDRKISPLDPIVTNSVSKIGIDGAFRAQNLTVSGQWSSKPLGGQSKDKDLKGSNSIKKKNKEKNVRKQKKYDSRLLPPLEEFRPLPKNDRRKGSPNRKQNRQVNGGLIPFPEYYVSWEKWESPRSAKWRRRYRRGRKKKNKNARSKGIPDHWVRETAARMNSLKNDVEHVHPLKWSPPIGSNPPMNAATHQKTCTRHDLFVDFRQLGWQKYIVAPKGFGTHYCGGHCSSPLALDEAGSNHAIIQSLLRASGFLQNLPAACCVPSALDSLTILMTEKEGQLALRTLPNMIVKACSCQ